MKKYKYSGFAHLLLPIVVVIVIVAIGGIVLLSQQNGNVTQQLTDLSKNVSQKPYDKLERAIDKTVSVQTMYLDFVIDETGMVTTHSNGLTQNIDVSLEGYVTGSTDGKTQKAEMKIKNAANPNLSITVETIGTENGDLYVKGGTFSKWVKLTPEEQEKQNSESPTDASLYGLNILSSIFSTSKALYKTIDESTVEELPQETIDGKSFSKYKVVLSTPDFIKALSNDPDITEQERKDAPVILQNAIIEAEYTVDNSLNYITSMDIDAKHLRIVPTEASKKLNVSTTYNMNIKANLSRFNVATNITPPPADEIEN